MGIEDTIEQLIGNLGISKRAETLMWKYNNHTKENYEILSCQPIVIGEYTITRYIRLTDYGKFTLRKTEENSGGKHEPKP